MALYGYDISKWQSVGAGDTAPDFVICKATEGVGYVDANCDKHYQRAKGQGKLLGAYHFARPDLNKGTAGAKREAEFFVASVKGYIGEAILVLDWEQPGTTGQISWAEAWLDHVYTLTGVRPLIYTSASVVNANNWSSVSADYGLWIAGYPNKYNVKNPPLPKVTDMPYKIGTWKFWAIWQYTSSAGTLDRNIANMDATAWKKYAGVKTVTTKPTPTPTPEKTEQAVENPVENSEHKEVEEQVESADKGLSAEEWSAILGKARETVKLAENTAKGLGIKIPMSNKVYDVLKVIVAIILPTISTVYLGLAGIWGFGFGEQVDETIQLIIVAINALLGVVIVKSSSDYRKGD